MKKHIDVSKKIVKSIPNMLTLCNSLCGFAAILNTLRAYGRPAEEQYDIFVISAVMIFCAMVFDAFDGFAARLLKAGSMHGIQMDSLSDMVTFGVAPAVLISVMTHAMRDDLKLFQEIYVYSLSAVYLGGAALRLATYNVKEMFPEEGVKIDHDYFSGLPTPGGAAAICVLVFFARETAMDLSKVALALPLYGAVLGLILVSNIPYLHAGRWLFSLPRKRMNLLLFLLMLLAIAFFKIEAVVTIVTLYVLSGPVIYIARKFKRA